ncbi:SET domain [Phaffia rhodozyma]|uniref:SET domain n=1 Tax=Phaffia rhodozyma TaxID=264483 RepID=A0A0F7SJJ6_PHARH|nr:SET domain [Phaffia rhodozyma]
MAYIDSGYTSEAEASPDPSAELLQSHPGLLTVTLRPGTADSYLVVNKDFKKGDSITKIQGWTREPQKAYSTVQVGVLPTDNIELNTSLLYINHSCNPNVAFNITSNPDDWYLEALRDLSEGDALSFFYPSTEWEMDRPFKCLCREKNCLGTIDGASKLPRSSLEAQAYISDHIWALKRKQESVSS